MRGYSLMILAAAAWCGPFTAAAVSADPIAPFTMANAAAHATGCINPAGESCFDSGSPYFVEVSDQRFFLSPGAAAAADTGLQSVPFQANYQAFADANSVSGTLSAYSRTFQFSNDVEGVAAASRAEIADRFITLDPAAVPQAPGGGLFNWESGTGVFTLLLTGVLPQPLDEGDPGAEAFGLGNGWDVELEIYHDETGMLLGACHWSGSVALPVETVPGENPCVIDPLLSLFGETIVYEAGTTLVAELKAQVNVGGDFAWRAALTTGAFSAGIGQGGEVDFSNTLLVSYQGPAGTHTTSLVGFNNFTGQPVAPVPEPASLSLFALGGCGLAAAWRRRGKQNP